MTEAARGSHKLLAELIKKGAAATADEVKAAVAVPAASDLKLLRWLIRGVPPFYYEVETVFETQAKQLSNIVNFLATNNGIREINILTHGTPVYDTAQITAVVAHTGRVE